MQRHPLALRLTLSASIALMPLFAGTAHAANPDVTFELRPHCDRGDPTAADNQFGGDVPNIDGTMSPTEDSALPCPEFAVRDPLSRQTDVLKVGDTLDMDLILHNPSKASLTRFRTWISYDSNVLEGTDLELSPAFPVATPGEADFSIADNYIKLSGTTEQAVSGETIVLARITLNIVSAPTMGTFLSFYDPSGAATSHTGVFVKNGDTEENMASTVQGSLAIRLQVAATASGAVVSSASSAASSVATVSSASGTSLSSVASSSSTAAVPSGLFSQLQVQALRITTEGSSVFLAWNPLPSAELVGYNIYYGTISGRYLQRRSVDKTSQTLTIRALPVGETYYAAVRGVNAAGEETDFSQEVAVNVGNAATSTSPLSGALIEGGPNGNAPHTGGAISGESGPGLWMLSLALLSAIMGTLLAVRRQWTASIPPR